MSADSFFDELSDGRAHRFAESFVSHVLVDELGRRADRRRSAAPTYADHHDVRALLVGVDEFRRTTRS